MIYKYLHIPHQYGIFDCIILVKQFYETELRCSIDLPGYSTSKRWMHEISLNSFDERASKYGKKVELTDAKNYDLISFKSTKGDYLIHFGLYIAPNSMLHVEEGKTSRIELLSDYWLERLYAIYRHDSLV